MFDNFSIRTNPKIHYKSSDLFEIITADALKNEAIE